MKGSFAKLLAALALGAVAVWAIPRKERKTVHPLIPAGESSTSLAESLGKNHDEMPIYYFRPASWTPHRPVFIAFTGADRKAGAFRTGLEAMAVKYNVLVACPEFSSRKFPGVLWYQEANVADKDSTEGHIRPRREWTFSVIDDIVRKVREDTGCRGPVILFGHSAGGQLLHRYSLLGHPGHIDRIVIANAGWFTMVDRKVNYPYGIGNLDISDKELARSFSLNLFLFMGSLDTERNMGFRETPEAEAEGGNRMERCRHYYASCRDYAKKLGVPFHWKLREIPGVAHEGAAMAEGVMQSFAGDEDDPLL